MASLKSHKIRTQTVAVEFEGSPNAHELNNQLSMVCKMKLLPALEKLFDEKALSKKYIQIDRLQVDAGKINKENWEDQFVNIVVKQLEEYLENLASGQSSHGDQKYDDPELSGDPYPFAKGEGMAIHEAGHEQEALLHFLKYGVLPWYSSIKNSEELQQEFNLQLNSGNDFSEEIQRLISTDIKVFRRLIYQFSEASLMHIWMKDGTRSEEIMESGKIWKHLFGLVKIPYHDQKMIFFNALRLIFIRYHTDLSNHDFTEDLAFAIAGSLKNEVRESLARLTDNPQSVNLEPKEKQIIDKIRSNDIGRSQEGLDTKLQEDTDNRADPVKRLNAPIFFNEENPVFISNAGLVLLHPFMAGLFENAGYTAGNLWKSNDLHVRSVLMTQFLVNGTEEYAEFEMVLNKLLTGFPLEESFPAEIKLSDFEKEQANDMLQAVIGHWKGLKNTSISGLQTTFIQREGKLVRKESGWLLHVDQKAFDILLEKIPWGFLTIKTPWMEEILSVEWI